jgi:hypothetical protein
MRARGMIGRCQEQQQMWQQQQQTSAASSSSSSTIINTLLARNGLSVAADTTLTVCTGCDILADCLPLCTPAL